MLGKGVGRAPRMARREALEDGRIGDLATVDRAPEPVAGPAVDGAEPAILGGPSVDEGLLLSGSWREDVLPHHGACDGPGLRAGVRGRVRDHRLLCHRALLGFGSGSVAR